MNQVECAENKTSKVFHRRDFLKLGLLTTAAVMTSNSVSAAEKITKETSKNIPAVIKPPIQKYVPKPYTHLLGGALKGISDNQLQAHFKLYEGYIAKINDLETRIKGFNPNNEDTVNYRGWHMDQTNMLNGAVLHELYFGNLGSSDKEPKGSLKKIIDRDFGNVQSFIGHLKAVGKVFHGWAIAAFNYRSGRINIYGLERHNLNVPTMAYPILTLDVYEHAYMIDYGTDRKKYLDAFIINLDWKPVQERLELAMSIPFGDTVTV